MKFSALTSFLQWSSFFLLLFLPWGMVKVGQSRFSSAPVAPNAVGYWLSRNLSSQGRVDAKKYAQINDYTRTHAILVAQNRALAGQREVNQWLIQNSSPLQVGTSRSVVKLAVLKAQLEHLKSEHVVGGRLIRRSQERMGILQREIVNTESQIDSNTSQLESLSMAAEQALGSWSNYYAQMAGVYARARANKLGRNVDSVSAEIPELENVALVDFAEFDAAEAALVENQTI